MAYRFALVRFIEVGAFGPDFLCKYSHQLAQTQLAQAKQPKVLILQAKGCFKPACLTKSRGQFYRDNRQSQGRG